MKWNKKTNRFIFLNDKKTKYKRLSRPNIILNEKTINRLNDGRFSDYHAKHHYKRRDIKTNQVVFDLIIQFFKNN